MAKKDRRSHTPIVKKERIDNRISVEDHNKRKKSLGVLRKHQKTKPRSPEATGKFLFQQHTLAEIVKQLNEIGGDEIRCNIAAWKNEDSHGPYLSVEISPEFFPCRRRQQSNDSAVEMFDDEDE
jgi:hypothetical protein